MEYLHSANVNNLITVKCNKIERSLVKMVLLIGTIEVLQIDS